MSLNQRAPVSESEASRDESIDLNAVKVLPGTGGPGDVGDEEAPLDYERTGHRELHATGPDGGSAGSVNSKTLDSNGTPVENPSG
ncbi:MAG TPA: hypothetical protein VHU91_09010 [Mycobacteriales bacterium]|jgi:hypothetical protein|nr:hypothetical protein [Mycobacteriales bacterium]